VDLCAADIHNAPEHSSGDVSEPLAKRGISVLSNLLYSPDLAPADFILFPKLKIAMKGTRFEAVSSIQQTVMRELKAIRDESFPRAFDSLMSDANVVPKREVTILSIDTNKHYLSFVRFYDLIYDLIVTPCIRNTS
jgi:hypothetical protein